MDSKHAILYVPENHYVFGLKKCGFVHLDLAQPKEPRLMVLTLHGPTGPGVASHVEKEVNSVIASATIPRRQTVERTARDWVKLQKSKAVVSVGVQLMVAIQSGVVGAAVARHVTEGLSAKFVHVPTRRLHMAGKTAGDWDRAHKHEVAIHSNAQVACFH